MRWLIEQIVAPFSMTVGGFLTLLSGAGVPVAVGQSPMALRQDDALVRQLEPASQDRSVLQRRPPALKRNGATAFVRTELFFGTAKALGAPVTEQEFRDFVDAVITPRFPDGLTVIKADGQFRGESGDTIKEASYVLILLYDADDQKDGSRKINEIRRIYMKQHSQESVLRVDDPFLVWVSF
jgi:hypothetical protein